MGNGSADFQRMEIVKALVELGEILSKFLNATLSLIAQRVLKALPLVRKLKPFNNLGRSPNVLSDLRARGLDVSDIE